MHDIRRLGLQVFAAPNNLTGEVQIEVKAREIDFVTSFGKNLKALLTASVMDTGTNTMMLVYSGIKEGSLTIHLQNHYDRPFDRIRVGNKTYGVDFSRKLRTKQVYVVSEVV